MPSIWLPMRFVIAGRLVEGVTLPGLPGRRPRPERQRRWGFTNLYADVEDLYRETIVRRKAGAARRGRPFASASETIAVRGGRAERLDVRETSHGPLVPGTSP